MGTLTAKKFNGLDSSFVVTVEEVLTLAFLCLHGGRSISLRGLSIPQVRPLLFSLTEVVATVR